MANTKTTPAPKRLIAEAKRLLKAAAKHWPPKKADTYFKPWEQVYSIGVSTPRLREIERKLYQATKDSWTAAEAVEFTEGLLKERYLEARSLGLMLLARFHRSFDPNLFARARGWLAGNLLNNWALTDLVATKILAPLVERHSDLAERLRPWAKSDSVWVRRAALATLVPFARKGQHLALAYGIAASVFEDVEELIHKATGWLLRECGKTNPRRLEAYLGAHGPRIPRITLRYAIERFPAAKRKEILEKTRGDGSEGVGRLAAAD
jgi:3-methyladenine DNA glycosylase AlkD